MGKAALDLRDLPSSDVQYSTVALVLSFSLSRLCPKHRDTILIDRDPLRLPAQLERIEIVYTVQ
jgi:hypothetical protein